MMHTEFLVVGGGIAGTLLSYELWRAGKHVCMMHDGQLQGASHVAAAVLNPLIANKWTVAQDADSNMPVAMASYKALEDLLGCSILQTQELWVCPSTAQEQAALNGQMVAGNSFIQPITEAESLTMQLLLQQEWAAAKVAPVHIINTAALLMGWQQYLQAKGCYIEEHFDQAAMQVNADIVHYKGLSAETIIFCEGALGSKNPYMPAQRFTHNRGDALLLRIADLPTNYIYHKGIRLVPRSDGLWWCGSNYVWQYNNLLPNKDWRATTEKQLSNWLRMPYETIEHLVAERPTTAGQQPILAKHERYGHVYFFNGLGTRGFSAGPRLAKEMAAMVMGLAC